MADKRSPLTIAILAGKAKGAGDESASKETEADEDTADADMGLESAFEEVAAAVKKGDTEAGVAALRSFVEQCRSKY